MTRSGFRVQGSGFPFPFPFPFPFAFAFAFAFRFGFGFSFWVLVLAVARVAAQTPDAEALYKANCASCHDQPQGRTPPREALKERTPEAILIAMTSGSMSMQAINL